MSCPWRTTPCVNHCNSDTNHCVTPPITQCPGRYGNLPFFSSSMPFLLKTPRGLEPLFRPAIEKKCTRSPGCSSPKRGNSSTRVDSFLRRPSIHTARAYLKNVPVPVWQPPPFGAPHERATLLPTTPSRHAAYDCASEGYLEPPHVPRVHISPLSWTPQMVAPSPDGRHGRVGGRADLLQSPVNPPVPPCPWTYRRGFRTNRIVNARLSGGVCHCHTTSSALSAVSEAGGALPVTLELIRRT